MNNMDYDHETDEVEKDHLPSYNNNSAKESKSDVPTGKKKKGLGLSPEQRKRLRQLIMQKVAEEMKAEAKKRAEEKETHLKQIVGPLSLDGLNDKQLEGKVRELHQRISVLEEDKFELEFKLGKQDYEIHELTTKVNDVKGKFAKPVLKKVSKTEAKFKKLGIRTSKIENESNLSEFRQHLKSTGQNKFALEEKEEIQKPNWADHRKGSHKEDGLDDKQHAEIVTNS